MKHLNYFLCLAAVLLGMSWASAETVQNYSVDFNTAISTSDHAFKVAPGWKHIVGSTTSGWSTTYMTYTYGETTGVDGSGALYCASQPSTSNYDYLVTPAVTGTVTLKVKVATYYSSSKGIKIYAINEDEDGTLTAGDLLLDMTGNDVLSSDEYTTVTVENVSDTRLGLVAYYAYLDDFAVDGSAELVYEPGLTITNVVSSVPSSGTINCDQDNNYSFTYTITVKNTGEMDLPADYENLSVSIVKYNETDVLLGTTPLGQALAMGEEATVDVTLNMAYADYPGRTRYDAKENVTGTTMTVTPWVEAKPYLPEITVRNENGYDMASYPSYAVTFGSFGMVNTDVTKTMVVRNTGAAPGNVSITVPDGFTADPANFTAEAGTSTNVAITLSAAEPGIKSGNLVVTVEGQDEPITIALSGTVLDTNKFFEGFEENKSSTSAPAGWYTPTGNWTKTSNTNGDNNFMRAGLLAAHKLVTPLLRVTEGEKMSFEAARQSSNQTEPFVKVYYSADRNEWTLAKEVTATEMTYNSYSTPTFTTFVVEGVPAGDWYIAFESGYCALDNVYGFEPVAVTHDVVVENFTIPTQVTANNDVTATVTLKNLLDEDETDYTPALYFNEVKVATAEPVTIAAGGTATIEFTFVPNEVGTFPAMAEFVFDEDYTATTDEVDVTVKEETAEKSVIVGNTDPSNTDAWSMSYATYVIPACPYYNYSWSEALYTPAMLTEAGLSEGETITGITYFGYNTSADVSSDVKVYIVSSDDDEFEQPFTMTDLSNLTPVYDGNYTFVKDGSSSSPIEMFKFDLAEPLTWDGKSMRIIVTSAITTTYKQVYFLADKQIGGEIYGFRSDGTALDAFISSSFSKQPAFPVTKFNVEAKPAVYSGVVTDTSGNPLEGVTVTLTSQMPETGEGAPRRAATAGAAVYTATTDAEGKFAVEVVQADKLYDANFRLEGYKDVDIEGVDFANGNVTLDEPVVMERENMTGVAAISGKTVAGVKYYNVAGQASDKAFPGVNIVVTTFTDGTTSTVKVIK